MKTFLWAPLLASMLIAPCYAGDLDGTGPATQLYVNFPLGAGAQKERAPSFGFTIRGRQEYQVFTLDSRTLTALSKISYDGGLIAGLVEAKWVLVGGVAAAGAVVVAKKGGGGPTGGPTKQGTPPPQSQQSQSQSQSQSQQQQQPNTPCTCSFF